MQSSIGLLFTVDMAQAKGFTLIDEVLSSDEAQEHDARLYSKKTATGTLYVVTTGHFVTVVTSSEYLARIALEKH